jgi:hypothetical protein
METKSKKRSPRDFKKKRGSPLRGTLQETPQRGAGSSGEPSRGAGATSEPTDEASAKGRVEPVVRNLPEVSFKIPLPRGVKTPNIRCRQDSPSQDKAVWLC